MNSPTTASSRLGDRLHLVVAILGTVLLAGSPWVSMYRRLPRDPSLFDYAHVGLGCIALGFGAVYAVVCLRRWRLYFPWLAGRFRRTLDDLAGLARGRVPSAEGGGLFAALEGLLLVVFLAAAVTGVGWLAAQGAGAALAWRDWHIGFAWAFGVLFVLHVVFVALHVLDFVRD